MDLKSKSVPIMRKCSIIKGEMEEKPKLLVVDDEVDIRESLVNHFSRRNFTVSAASTGEEALRLIKENKPDLVILDMKLEGNLEGKDVLRILRETDKDTKVAMVTGAVLSEQEMQDIADLGIVDFVHKPVDIHTLEVLIKKVLERSYPKAVKFEVIMSKEPGEDTSLRRLAHDLSNISSDIINKCELYTLDEEEGLNKKKSEKERLAETTDILKAVLKHKERLVDIVQKLSSLAKKET
ncbi:MAG: response regulator [Candidatus Omnitrophota bacterium]|jgi:DNA-binding response OmpR family regulator|nr:MAG: response regulator [Candidatus Omnitrophota bacterium]